MNRLRNNPPIPLYYTLVEYIKKQIIEEELKPGETIPSERELISTFSLSRTTVRKAIDVLVNDGLLIKVQGKGTFVQNKKINDGLIKLTSCTESIKNMGLEPSRRIIKCGINIPIKCIGEKLQLKEDEKVFELERVLYGDDAPINVTKSFTSYKYIKGVEEYNYEKESLYNVLETKLNIKIIHSVRTIEAVLASEKDSELLNINIGSPILIFNGVVYGEVSGKEVPIEYFVARYRCDKTKFYIEQVR
ncbi:GntR family transcriptional regulator [Clostridium rectalis]|uniref:GntR family transcriptional regulator n=1 Tax=Clostridium rectalis TaxID=2040295 RepID=UPI000F6398FB|nr:GntR family transcriptional regulator [Clostridium rectalis]